MILSVNIDHIATIRNARNSNYPNLLRAIEIIKTASAEIVTIHLREDRRHIRDDDVITICEHSPLPVNLEIAPTKEMVKIALKLKPKYVCFVPEKREEITTEGGLDISLHFKKLEEYTKALQENGTEVSFFIEPSLQIITLAKDCGANTIELHTGKFAEDGRPEELKKIVLCAEYAFKLGLKVHAGHGLTFESATKIAKIPHISILHIGHFLITESIFVGLYSAVCKMRQAISNL